MSTEEIYYWRGMAKANLEDWDGAAQDLRRAHLLNPDFLSAGKEKKQYVIPSDLPTLKVPLLCWDLADVENQFRRIRATTSSWIWRCLRLLPDGVSFFLFFRPINHHFSYLNNQEGTKQYNNFVIAFGEMKLQGRKLPDGN